MPLSLSPSLWLRLGGVAALFAFATWSWRIDSLRDAHLVALRQCRAAAERQVETFRHAQQSAAAMAQETRMKKEAEYETARNASDDRLADLRKRYSTLVLRQTAADRRGPAHADLPRPPSATGRADGAGPDPVLPDGPPADRHEQSTMTIDMRDSLICADNTARLQAAQIWVNDLQR